MSAEHSATLFDYWQSSASYRVRIALGLAGIPYETVGVDLIKGEQRKQPHLARNPQGFVPVLEIDGERFTQSLAIIEYLNDTREMGLLPENPGTRAKARALAFSIAIDIHPVCNTSVIQHVLSLTAGGEAERVAWMRHFIGKGLESFEKLLSGFDQKPFCCGNRPGLADICLVPQAYNAMRWGVGISAHQRIEGVLAACAEHPAFKAAHPDRMKP